MAIREITQLGRLGGDPQTPEYWEFMQDLRICVMPDEALRQLIAEAKRRGVAIFGSTEEIQKIINEIPSAAS